MFVRVWEGGKADRLGIYCLSHPNAHSANDSLSLIHPALHTSVKRDPWWNIIFPIIHAWSVQHKYIESENIKGAKRCIHKITGFYGPPQTAINVSKWGSDHSHFQKGYTFTQYTMASSIKWWVPLAFLKYNLIGKISNKYSHVISHIWVMFFHQNAHITSM